MGDEDSAILRVLLRSSTILPLSVYMWFSYKACNGAIRCSMLESRKCFLEELRPIAGLSHRMLPVKNTAIFGTWPLM